MPLPQKRNFLRDVLPKRAIDGSSVIKKIKTESDVVYHKIADPVIEYNGGGRWRIWLVAVISVIILVVAVFYAFSKAEVIITERTDEIKIDNIFSAKSNVSTGKLVGELGYNVTSVEKLGTKSVMADGEKKVERKATGTIIVYNNFSNSSQKLIKNTRFETADHLIFRIDRSILIPGKTTVDGKAVPGSVEAVVYADEAGTKYNVGLTDFTVPGFKSDPSRYAGFYARSKTPMTDGFSGSARYVSDTKQKLIRAEIRAELEKTIVEETRASMDKLMFVPKNAYFVEFESLASENSAGEAVTIKEKAKLTIFSFTKKDWDMFLAEQTPFASTIGSSSIEMLNRDDLTFGWQTRPKADAEEISFKVSGSAKFVWNVNKDKIVKSLVGKNKKEAQEFLQKVKEIASAEAVLAPFWRTKFPTEISKIKLIINAPVL